MCFRGRLNLVLALLFICLAATSAAAQSNKDSEIDEIRNQLREQREEINRLTKALAEQQQIINELRAGRVDQPERVSPIQTTLSTADSTQENTVESRLSKLEAETKKTSDALSRQLGSITFSGELRVQYDSFYRQLNSLPNSSNPAIAGNTLSSRQRGRFRARFALGGQFGNDVLLGSFDQSGQPQKGKEFDWGLRFSSGSLANVVSSNQILTDFYNRKPFALDRAFVGWRPRSIPGLRLQAGKFDPPWAHTELTIDNDLQPEGLSETYTRGFKDSTFKNISLAAWQLPFLERNSAFVRNANGTVNIDESRRAGRDLALYGAQVQTRLGLAKKVDLTLSVADLYFGGTQFITPIQFLGNQLQLPVTINIPATGTTPAQTVTGVATISRELLVAGNGNLGISIATNNATNRDGRLSSGFNLVDTIARLDISSREKYPITLIFNYVRNTQVHDVVIAGPGGSDLFLPNNEDSGYWAEFQMKRLRARKANEKLSTPVRGDLSFGYTFIRIEKDAVLTPFNFDDLLQFSDVRVHRFGFTYFADSKVTLNFTALVNQRPNGLLGVFGQTPPGSLNRPTIRLQFDTIFRFN